MHRAPCKRKLEHSFVIHPDMERICLESGGKHGDVQHDGKYDPVPLQMQYELQLEQFDIEM